MITNVDVKKDTFNLCEMIFNAFHASVIASNTVSGFNQTGLSPQSGQSVDSLMIQEDDFTFSAVRKIFNDSSNTLSETGSVKSSFCPTSNNQD